MERPKRIEKRGYERLDASRHLFCLPSSTPAPRYHMQDPHRKERNIPKRLQQRLLLPFGLIKELHTFSVHSHNTKILPSVEEAPRRANIGVLGVAFFIGIVGVIYQSVGLMASERELGMTQIIEASMPNERRWEPQAIRLLAIPDPTPERSLEKGLGGNLKLTSTLTWQIHSSSYLLYPP